MSLVKLLDERRWELTFLDALFPLYPSKSSPPFAVPCCGNRILLTQRGSFSTQQSERSRFCRVQLGEFPDKIRLATVPSYLYFFRKKTRVQIASRNETYISEQPGPVSLIKREPNNHAKLFLQSQLYEVMTRDHNQPVRLISMTAGKKTLTVIKHAELWVRKFTSALLKFVSRLYFCNFYSSA